MLISGCLIDNRTYCEEIFSKGTSHILECVCLKLLEAWDYLLNNSFAIEDFTEI